MDALGRASLQSSNCGETARTPTKLDSIALAHSESNVPLSKAVCRLEDILHRLGHHEGPQGEAKSPPQAPTPSGFTHSMLASLTQQGNLLGRLHCLLDTLEQYI
jgi:hypothetical protein